MSATAEHITRARSNLIMDAPFFGNLSLRLKLKETEDVSTMATDGVFLYYHPKSILGWSLPETKGVVCHEVLHVVLKHPTRRNNRDPKLWNIACDYAINLIVKDSGFILPKDALYDETYRDMTADEIYNILINTNEEDIPKMPMWGLVTDYTNEQGDSDQPQATKAEVLDHELNWDIAIKQAVNDAKQAGKLPGSLEDIIKEACEPVVDWKDQLWPFYQSSTNNEYSWRKPNRAYISEDEYLPSLYDESLGKIAWIWDVSGSVSNKDLAQFWSENCAIAFETSPAEIVLLQVDTKVRTESIKVIDNLEDIDPEKPPKVYGRGGTQFSPAFEYLNEHHSDITLAIYLTDLECNDFGPEPDYPVLWVSTNKRHRTVPWGSVIYLTQD